MEVASRRRIVAHFKTPHGQFPSALVIALKNAYPRRRQTGQHKVFLRPTPRTRFLRTQNLPNKCQLTENDVSAASTGVFIFTSAVDRPKRTFDFDRPRPGRLRPSNSDTLKRSEEHTSELQSPDH